MSNAFKAGDKVFAKVKGYPSWPAKIVSVVGNKYNVEFYGTRETGLIKEENVCYYRRNRDRLTINIRRKLFHEAVAEIEEAIRKEGGDGDPIPYDDGIPGGSRTAVKRKRSESDTPKAKNVILNDDEVTSSKEESTDETVKPEKKAEEKEKGENSEIPPKKFNFMLISETYLQNCIAYAKYVMESEHFYKNRPVEPRDEPLEPVLAVQLPAGEVIGVKMYPKWPPPVFATEHKRALYDEVSARKALQCKDAVRESGEKVKSKGRIVAELGVTMEEVKSTLRARDRAERTRMRDRLSSESSLANHEIQIQRCLRIDGAEPLEALAHLDAIHSMTLNPDSTLNSDSTLTLDSLTLRKHPRTVEVIRKIRRYDGNVAEWKMSEEERGKFDVAAASVRKRASEIYDKFKVIMDFSGEGSFYEKFTETVEKFNRLCEGLSEKEKMALCAEPKSREAFMHRMNETGLEKENSSNVANGE